MNIIINNLLQIAKIKKNEKIYILNNIIYSYPDTFVNSVLRKFYYCENRFRTYVFLDEIINQAKYKIQNLSKVEQQKLITGAIIGINNLIFTYSVDIVFKNKLKILQKKLEELT